MGRGSKTTELLKECMGDTLLTLMREKPFEKITYQEIAEKAGVGRSTWFRNFSCKEEAITFRLLQLWNRWAREHGIPENGRYTMGDAGTFFDFIYSIRDTLLVLYRADKQACIYETFYQAITPQHIDDAERYVSRFYSYGLFGLVNEWASRDFKETPQEMARLFAALR